MATPFLWGTRGTAYNLLTTQLNTLASGSICAAGPEIDNTTNAYQRGMLHLHIASNSLALVDGSQCNVYLFPSLNGATYPNFTSGASPRLARTNYLVGTIALFPGTISAVPLDEYLRDVPIPDGKFKAALEYFGAGAANWPGSGNTLNLYPTPDQY
jgi:hypothetical protein